MPELPADLRGQVSAALAEDIGASALYVANAGIACAFRSGTFISDELLQPVIDDTLDAIEYAIGPVTSKYGAMRAKNGHPAPFPLKYIEVGNEDQGAKYGARFTEPCPCRPRSAST